MKHVECSGSVGRALDWRAVYHKRGNHTVTLYEERVKIRYHLRGSPLG